MRIFEGRGREIVISRKAASRKECPCDIWTKSYYTLNPIFDRSLASYTEETIPERKDIFARPDSRARRACEIDLLRKGEPCHHVLHRWLPRVKRERERERVGVSRFLEIITKLNAFFSNGNASSIDCALHVDSAKRENTPVQWFLYSDSLVNFIISWHVRTSFFPSFFLLFVDLSKDKRFIHVIRLQRT